MLRALSIAALAVAFALPISGCGWVGGEAEVADQAGPRLVVGETTPTSAETPADPASGEQSNAPTPADGEEISSGEPELALPFPDRLDMFQEPDVELVSRPELQDESADLSRLQLKGFVDVADGGEKALVLWDDRVRAVSEGDFLGQIEIIEIAPPQIRLQRGRVRWIETIDSMSASNDG